MPGRQQNVAVIGAGPAGLTAAIYAAKNNCRVTVFEQQRLPGMKLLASGGGRCNLTNALDIEDFAAAFGRQGRFTLPALRRLPPLKLRDFFSKHGVKTILTDGFHVFPASGKARDILDVLLGLCKKHGVELKKQCKVEKLIIENDHIAGLVSSAGEFRFDRVLIAGGGRGYPKLGGSSTAYSLAEQAGHKIVTPLPALTGLRCDESWPGRCTGISFDNVEAYIDLPKYRKKIHSGELLFTHYGVSGPAVIDLAGEVSVLLQKHKEIPLKIRLFPGVSAEKWQKIFQQEQVNNGKKQFSGVLARYLPKKLANEFSGLAGIPPQLKTAELNAASRLSLCTLLEAVPLSINSTDPWEKAMLTHGGVSLRKISPDTLESRLVKGLFFAGEVLDLQGPCGGYNLQWAFSSGALAGSATGE
jgi:hypothetical protein